MREPMPMQRAGAATTAALMLLTGVACSDGDPASPDDPCATGIVGYPDEVTQTGQTVYVHDPEIVQAGERYYVFSSGPGIQIRNSTDLLEWEYQGRALPTFPPPWAADVPTDSSAWAPAIARFNGLYHLYYSIATWGSHRSAIGLATSPTLDPDAPAYGWQDRGQVFQSFPENYTNAIDAAVVQGEDGGVWLVWGSHWGGIVMRALDPETGMLSPGDETVHVLAQRPIEVAVEAAYVVHRGSYYYLFVSFDYCCRGIASTYNVRVGRSADVTGPYLDRAGRPMADGGGTPVLTGYGRVYGPGHASVLARDGHYLLVHHFYDALDRGNPHLQVRPLLWTDDGWPVAGLPFDGTDPAPPPPDADLTGDWGYWAGRESPLRTRLGPDGSVSRCDGHGTWSYEAPVLTVWWKWDGGAERTDRLVLSGDGDVLAGWADDDTITRAYRLPPEP